MEAAIHLRTLPRQDAEVQQEDLDCPDQLLACGREDHAVRAGVAVGIEVAAQERRDDVSG
jgi:hypothetical protein